MIREWARAGGFACLAATVAGCTASVLPTVTVTVTVNGSPSAQDSGSPGGQAVPSAAVQKARDAVFRIRTASCTPGHQGLVATGFAIDEHLVVTAAHVVEYQQQIEVASDASGGEAHVLGFDAQADVALLWVDTSSLAAVSFAEAPPKQADQVALLGFPQSAQEVQVTSAAVTGVDGAGTVSGGEATIQRDGLVVTDAAADPGNSGGPVIAADGHVVGMVSSQALDYSSDEARIVPSGGVAYAVPPGQFVDLLEQWRSNTSPVNTCNPDSVNHVIKNLDTAPAGAVDALAALDSFWLAVNAADFAGAWAKLNARGQQVKGSYERWSAKMSGAQYADGYLETARASSGTASATVVVNLTESTSAGETRCRVWRLTYSLTDESGQWLVGPFGGRSIGRC